MERLVRSNQGLRGPSPEGAVRHWAGFADTARVFLFLTG